MTIKPILYLAFNRPEETAVTFDAIRRLGPKKLYIAVDGPRNSEDTAKCEEVISIVKNIDWNCEVRYLIREKNLGCRWGVSNALDWFFEHEECGVIIEDDIVMSEVGYHFISELLDYYESNQSVMMVCASNLLGKYNVKADYFFSRIGSVWGWGAWRRSWSAHDPHFKDWPVIKESRVLFDKMPLRQAIHRESTGDAVFYNGLRSWSYPFTIRRIINDGFAAMPRVNLCKNIGFNENATHTLSKPEFMPNQLMELAVDSLDHADKVEPDEIFDQMVFDKQNPRPSYLQRIKGKLKLLLKQFV